LLQAEGLFDPALKKRLPFLPRAVGLVTGAASAAERDVVEKRPRRWPAVRIVTRHALVQGPQAGEQIIAAVQQLDRQDGVDVIILRAAAADRWRDLLPFSDEGWSERSSPAVRLVVSAIGHESDSPILDLVADVRASTPTDAAKRVVPDVADELVRIGQARERLGAAIVGRVNREQEWLRSTRFPTRARRPDGQFRGAGTTSSPRSGTEPGGPSVPPSTESVMWSSISWPRSGPCLPRRRWSGGTRSWWGRTGMLSALIATVDVGDDLLAYLADGQLVVEVRETRAQGAA
jgi:exodeoxyribonuclease VII large subunit